MVQHKGIGAKQLGTGVSAQNGVEQGIRVAMAVCCAAQHATPYSIAQHLRALQHNVTTGITYA